MNPMFSLKRLQSFLPILNDKSKKILKDLENEIGKPDFDVMHYTSTCTLSAVCSKKNYCEKELFVSYVQIQMFQLIFLETIMGIDVDTQPDKGEQYLNSLSQCVNEI